MSKGTVPITGTITTTNELDTYPTHWDKYAKGGFRTVTDSTQRDAITTERRMEGMQVYVRDIKQLQQLIGGTDNTKWVTLLTIDSNNKIVVNNDLNLQKYIVEGGATTLLPNAVALGDQPDGYLINTLGKVTTTSIIDPVGISLTSGKLLIGDISNKASETQIVNINNLPVEFDKSGMVKYDSASSKFKIAIEDTDYATVVTLNAIAATAQKSADAASSSASLASKEATIAVGAAAEATGAASLANGYAISAGESMTAAGASVLLASGFANDASNSASSSADSASTSAAASKVAGERQVAAETAATNAQNSLDTLLKTGLNALPNSGDVNFQGFKGINVAAGVNPTDLVIVSQITDITDDYVKTVKGTANQIVSTGIQDITLNIAPTYPGQNSITTLGTVTTGTWKGSVIPLANGGTNANITASNGGIVYSTATSLAVLSGTLNENRLLISGSSGAPSWTSRCIDYGIANPATDGNFFIATGCGVSGITNASQNTGTGIRCMVSLSPSGSATSNSGYGSSCLFSLTTGSLNSAFGSGSSFSLTTGIENTSIGQNSLRFNVTTNENTSGGYNSLQLLTGGSGKNSAWGSEAGSTQSSYTQCTFLGAYSDASINGLTNATSVGQGAIVDESNCIQLGNPSVTKIKSAASVILNTNKIHLDAINGRIGIGILSPTTAKLVVSGGITNTSNEETAIRVVTSSSSLTAVKMELQNTAAGGRLWELRSLSNGTFDIVDRTASAGRFNINSTGGVGIGVAADQLLSVGGNASKSGGGSWATFSDKRIKKVLGSYEQGLDAILKVKPKKFKYNDKSGYSEDEQAKTRIGIVAQEIEDIFPECIVDKIEKDDMKDVMVYEDTALTYALINAVKELNTKIEKLEARKCSCGT